MEKNNCKKCGHSWVQRSEEAPVQCPRCKRYNWNENGDGNEDQ